MLLEGDLRHFVHDNNILQFTFYCLVILRIIYSYFWLLAFSMKCLPFSCFFIETSSMGQKLHFQHNS